MSRNWCSSALLVGCKITELLWKTVWLFYKKIKIKIKPPCVTAVLILDNYPKELKCQRYIGISTLMFIAALFTITKM
jgi:hypothetical protein